MLACEEAFSPDALERGRLFFASRMDFLLGIEKLENLPPPFPNEIAFAGRSNVGKSSLLNALCHHHGLARVSNTPGRTRQLNFFSNAERRIALVDMPGYGYALVDKAQHKRWQTLLSGYLRGRMALKRVFVLIDARHGVMAGDRSTLDLLDDHAVNYQIVLTKADKISLKDSHDLVHATAQELKKRPAAHPRIHLTSKTSLGLSLLRAEFADF